MKTEKEFNVSTKSFATDSKKGKKIKNEELKNINGGFKIKYNDDNPEELSLLEKILKIFFKN